MSRWATIAAVFVGGGTMVFAAADSSIHVTARVIFGALAVVLMFACGWAMGGNAALDSLLLRFNAIHRAGGHIKPYAESLQRNRERLQ